MGLLSDNLSAVAISQRKNEVRAGRLMNQIQLGAISPESWRKLEEYLPIQVQMQIENEQKRILARLGCNTLQVFFARTGWMFWRVENYSCRNCQIDPFYRGCLRGSIVMQLQAVSSVSIFHEKSSGCKKKELLLLGLVEQEFFSLTHFESFFLACLNSWLKKEKSDIGFQFTLTWRYKKSLSPYFVLTFYYSFIIIIIISHACKDALGPLKVINLTEIFRIESLILTFYCPAIQLNYIFDRPESCRHLCYKIYFGKKIPCQGLRSNNLETKLNHSMPNLLICTEECKPTKSPSVGTGRFQEQQHQQWLSDLQQFYRCFLYNLKNNQFLIYCKKKIYLFSDLKSSWKSQYWLLITFIIYPIWTTSCFSILSFNFTTSFIYN